MDAERQSHQEASREQTPELHILASRTRVGVLPRRT